VAGDAGCENAADAANQMTSKQQPQFLLGIKYVESEF
jgi:hypothetical protein